MTFPTPYVVGLHAYSSGGKDARGNDIAIYTPPKTVPGTELTVYGLAPAGRERGGAEPKLAGHDRVIVDLELLAPEGFPAKPRDLVDVGFGSAPGRYEVIGHLEDYTTGPFGWAPGVVCNLRKVDG